MGKGGAVLSRGHRAAVEWGGGGNSDVAGRRRGSGSGRASLPPPPSRRLVGGRRPSHDIRSAFDKIRLPSVESREADRPSPGLPCCCSAGVAGQPDQICRRPTGTGGAN